MKNTKYIFAIVITALLVGLGIFVWQKAASEKHTKELQDQLETLKDTADTKPVADSSASTTPAESSPVASPATSNVFDVATAKVGDKVGAMTIVSNNKYGVSNTYPGSNTDATVEFAGQVTVHVTYTLIALAEFGPPDTLEFGIDSQDSSKIPLLTTDISNMTDGLLPAYALRATVPDDQKIRVKKDLGITGADARGTATITIDHFVLRRCECDGLGNTMSIVSASNVADEISDWQNFSSKFFTLSFKYPKGFEVKEGQDYILVSKSPFEKISLSQDTGFMHLTRYGTTYSQGDQITNYRRTMKDIKESETSVDGKMFKEFFGSDNAPSGSYDQGEEIVVFFDKSWLDIINRPNSKDVDATFYKGDSPTLLGRKILSTFKFSK